MKLEEFLLDYLPPEDGRTKLRSHRALMVLIRNTLMARAPIYGVGEWACGYAPDLLGLSEPEMELLNDDRVGRALDKLYKADHASLALSVAAHVIKRFNVRLDQLHNDSTTISFFGAYDAQGIETPDPDHPELISITWGHSKDHRPDLKQLLYILTVAQDGAVPIHYRAASGNVTDDITHRDTWELLCQLAERRDFLYVADCKLGTSENMRYIHRNGGRFITVLPRTRREDKAFRKQLARGEVTWQAIMDKVNDDGEVIDQFSAIRTPVLSQEGFRIWWFHSTRKAELDAVARTGRINRANAELTELEEKLYSPKARIRTKEKATEAVRQILRRHSVEDLFTVKITEYESPLFRQERRGRPTKDTRYVRQARTFCSLKFDLNQQAIARDRSRDGVFPLITNVESLTALDVLEAYKKQPLVENRFSQLKTDFRVAPVYLKSVPRIEALLCVYFFVMMTQALLERELRLAMERAKADSVPLYPEGRPCRRPTARLVINLFDGVERHMLQAAGRKPAIMVTEISRAQRRILKLLRLSPADYGR
jgi:transposase